MVKRSKSCMDKNDAGEMEKHEKRGAEGKGNAAGRKEEGQTKRLSMHT